MSQLDFTRFPGGRETEGTSHVSRIVPRLGVANQGLDDMYRSVKPEWKHGHVEYMR